MSNEAPSKTERKLNRTGNKQTLQGVVGDTDADDIDIFGYEIIYTTGEFLVDRDALLDKAEEVGIADWMLPSKVKSHYAFGRMIDDLLEGRQEIEWEDQRVQFDLRKNENRYSYTLRAEVFFPPEMTSDNEGKWKAVENEDGDQGLGVIKYDADSGSVRFVDYVNADMSLYPIWAAEADNALNGGFKQRAEALMEKHRESHTGKDVNNLTYYLVDTWTDSIRLRDAAYFVPANHEYQIEGETRPIEDLIDAFRTLYQWLDAQAFDPQSDIVEKPDKAQHTEMHVIEIMDTERQREMVEDKVEQELEVMAGELLDDTLDALQDDETMVDDVADEVAGTLDEIDAIAGEYNSLLKVQNSVKRVLGQALGDLDEDREELIREVLDGIDEAPDLDAEQAAA